MQLPKGISGIFRGVLGAVPVIDNSCAEVVTERHRAVSISVASTLAAAAITVMWARLRRLSLIAPTQNRITEFCAQQYLKESSTKVVQTLFLMILGIQLYKYNKYLSEKCAVSDSGTHGRSTPVGNVDFGSRNDVVIGHSDAFNSQTLAWDFWRGAEVSAFIVCVFMCVQVIGWLSEHVDGGEADSLC